MKILYAIQGTGNGHMSRARHIVPCLEQHGEVDLLVSWSRQTELDLGRPLTYRFHGLGYIFGKTGGIDYAQTLRHVRLREFIKDIRALPVDRYDLVISDFEPISAWACQLHHRACVLMSHQASFLSPKTPRPQGAPHPAELILRFYAPGTDTVAFHFDRYDTFIHTPVIRREVRALSPRNQGHVTVYLPAHDHRELVRRLAPIRGIAWEVFTKERGQAYTTGSVKVQTVQNEAFLQSLEGCSGLISGGGFETNAEALYLAKKLLVIPMRGQYEQQCNAEALRRMGVAVLADIGHDFAERVESWLTNDEVIHVDYLDETDMIVADVVRRYKGR